MTLYIFTGMLWLTRPAGINIRLAYMNLPVRSWMVHPPVPALALMGNTLEADPAQETNGVPWVSGTFDRPVAHRLTILVRLHNRAGIPIIAGRSIVEVGAQDFT